MPADSTLSGVAGVLSVTGGSSVAGDSNVSGDSSVFAGVASVFNAAVDDASVSGLAGVSRSHLAW